MQNHTYSNNKTEPTNQTPEVAVGLANMPAPIAVPATIIAPPKRVGLERVCMAVISVLMSEYKAAYSTHKRITLCALKQRSTCALWVAV